MKHPKIQCILGCLHISIFQVSEVKAAFVLWDTEGNCSVNDPILEVLNQPVDCAVFNQTVVTCYAPPQNWDVIQAIKAKNFELRICAYRPSDNRISMNSFKYEYLPHVQSQPTQEFEGPSGMYYIHMMHLGLPNYPVISNSGRPIPILGIGIDRYWQIF